MNVEHARSNFPVLNTGFIFADNAGGSQAAKGVVDRISDYLLNTNVQLGADYAYGVQSSTRVFVDGPREAVKLFNARSPDEIVFGASSTLNFDNLSRGLEKDIQPGDEFIITGEHEANAGPWKKLAARKGAVIKIWTPSPTVPENPYSVKLKLEELLPLVSSRTRIVAITACSNILGSIIPVKEVVKAVRAEAKAQGAPKVEISVDCVAYAPHRLIDVQDWDVDFAAFSFYKVYGPHISGMYVRSTAKLQPGGPGYEAVYGTTGVVPYLLSLTPQNDLKASFDAIAQHEQTLLQPLIAFLVAPAQRERGVRIVGEETVNLDRVPTVSFVVVGQKPLKSRAIVEYFDAKGGVGIRYGHFYAYTMVDQLSPKIDIDEGVVRISLVHYNTVKEVEKIIEVLKEVFAQDDLGLAPKERTTSGY